MLQRVGLLQNIFFSITWYKLRLKLSEISGQDQKNVAHKRVSDQLLKDQVSLLENLDKQSQLVLMKDGN